MTDRTAFEAHFQLTTRQQKRYMNGDYRDPDMHTKWQGFQFGLEQAAKICMEVAEASDDAERKHGAYSCTGRIRQAKTS